MPAIDPVKLRPGMKIVVDDQLWLVTQFDHRTPGNLRSFVVCKLKSIQDGRVIEKTFRGAGEYPQTAEFEQRTCQYLYSDADGYHFMDTGTYEQFSLPEEFLGLQASFLMTEAEVIVSFWDGKPIGLELPPKMVFTVVDTVDDIARGNSSGAITKDAKLNSGLTIQVPPFVKTGDKVRISTDDGSYVERA